MQWIYWCNCLYFLLVFCHKNTCWLVFFLNFIYFRSRNFNTDGWCSLSTDNFLSCGCSSHLFSEKETKKTNLQNRKVKKNFVLFIITYKKNSVCCFLNKQFLFFAKSLLIHQKSQKWAKLKVFFFCAHFGQNRLNDFTIFSLLKKWW